MTGSPPADEQTARNLILVAAVGSPLGVALSTAGQQDFGAAALILSVATALVGLHKFGRTGS